MPIKPAINQRNALIGSLMVFLAFGLMFASPFQVEAAAPNSPTNLVGRVAHDDVTLYWDTPTGGASPTDYRIFRRNNNVNPSGGFEVLRTLSGIDGPPTSFRDSNEMGGRRNYDYAVAAVNDDGESGKTNTFNALVPANYISDAETWRSHSLTATRSSGQVTLNWEVISTARVLGYEIRRKTASGRWQVLVADTQSTARTYNDSVGSGRYRYKVRAHYDPLVVDEDGGRVTSRKGKVSNRVWVN